MTSYSRSEVINRLADPLRGRYSKYDELTSDDESRSGCSTPGRKHKARSPVNGEDKQQKEATKKENRRRSSLKKAQKNSTGFFLTESVENYDDDVFDEGAGSDEDEKSVSSFQMKFEREKNSKISITPRRSLSGQKESRALCQKYDKEINESMSRSIQKLLVSQTKGMGSGSGSGNGTAAVIGTEVQNLENLEDDDIFGSDDVLSRVRKRLEEATALEYLIEQNQNRENLQNESRIHRHEQQQYNKHVQPNLRINRDVRPAVISKPSVRNTPVMHHPKMKKDLRRKAWEDPLHNKNANKMRIEKGVLSSHSDQMGLKNSKIPRPVNKFERVRVSNIIPTQKSRKSVPIIGSKLSKKSNGVNKLNGDNGGVYRVDNEFIARRHSEMNGKKKDIFLSQLGGRSRVKENEMDKENMKPIRGRVKGFNVNAHPLPVISESRKRVIQVRSEIREREKVDLRGTFMTDFSALDFDNELKSKSSSENRGMDSEREILVGRKNKNILDLNEKIRNNLARKRIMESRSAPELNLNHLERVDIDGKIKNLNGLNGVNEQYGQGQGNKYTSPSKVLRSPGRFKRDSVVTDPPIAVGLNPGRRGVRQNSRVRGDDSDKNDISPSKKNSHHRVNGVSSEKYVPSSSEPDAPQSIPHMQNRVEIKGRRKSVHRPTDEIINLLSQVEMKANGRVKVARGSVDEGDTAAIQLIKHAKRLGSHWAAAESFASKYDSLGDDNLDLE